MAKLSSNDILPLIHTYLIEIGMQKVAKKLQKAAGIDLQQNLWILFFKEKEKIIFFILEKGNIRKKIEKNLQILLETSSVNR